MINIGIIAPSYYIEKEKIEKIEKLFFDNGINCIFAKNVFKKHFMYAGKESERINGIMEIFSNKKDNLKYVLALRGGDGCSSIVDKLDYNIIKKSEKIFCGYSDVTALHSSIIEKTGLKTLYSLNASNFIDDNEKTNIESKNIMLDLFKYNSIELFNKKILEGTRIFKHGKANGITIGGNITLLNENIATFGDASFDNKILILEDARKNIVDLYNGLTHLKRAGKFKNIAGLIFGEFFKIENNLDMNLNMDYIVQDIFDEYNIPIVTNVGFGHGKNKFYFPLNVNITIDTFNRNNILSI